MQRYDGTACQPPPAAALEQEPGTPVEVEVDPLTSLLAIICQAWGFHVETVSVENGPWVYEVTRPTVQ